MIMTKRIAAPVPGNQNSVRELVLYRQPAFAGAMRKHSGWKHDFIDKGLAQLDALATLATFNRAKVLRRAARGSLAGKVIRCA